VEDMEKNFVASSVRKGHKVGQTHLVCLSTIRNADDVIKTKPPRELNLSLVQSRFDRIMFGRPVSPAQANAYNALFFLTFFFPLLIIGFSYLRFFSGLMLLLATAY